METVNSQISASHQSATGTKNPIGSYRSGPPRRRRRSRKPRADQRLHLSQRNASLESRKLQNKLCIDAPAEITAVLEFSIDGLYPNDDVIYPPPPNFSHYQISAQELRPDIVSPRAHDVNHNRLSSLTDDESLCPLQEDNKRENDERTPHVLPDEWEHKIHPKGLREEPNIRDRQTTKNVPYSNDRGRRNLLQPSILPYVISPPLSRDPSLSTVHDTVEQSTDEVEAPRSETVLKDSETRPQVVKANSDMQVGHTMVDIEGEPSRERDGVILPVSQRFRSPLALSLGQVVSKSKSPAHNMKLNKSSAGAPVSRPSKSIGGPWTNQKYQMFSNFDMWP